MKKTNSLYQLILSSFGLAITLSAQAGSKSYMNYSKLNKYIYTTLSIAIFYCLLSPAYSQSMHVNLTTYNQQMNVSLNENIRFHQNIIKNKLDYYSSIFEEIKFIHLNGGDDWQPELDTVLKLLGDNAVVLDYEHPKEQQEELMYLTIERLKYLLENDGISSTLFHVGDKSEIKQDNLCIVTLNPEILVIDESAPLDYMLNYSDTIIKKIHPSRYIDSQSFIKFSLDHEVFHCLNSFLFGGVPITFEVLGGEYNQLLCEYSADAFALIMHLKNNGELTNFARNMTHVRALSIFNNDLNHNTLEILLKILRLDLNKVKVMNIMEIISLSVHMANETIGSYSDFRNQYALERETTRMLGYEDLGSVEKTNDLEKVITNPLKIELLAEHTRYFYMKLFTDSVVDLDLIQ